MSRSLIFGIALVLGTVSAAHAGSVSTRAELDALLGAGQTFENFESLPVTPGGQISGAGPISSTSTFAGYGPGLVQAGATYVAPTFFWNGDGYYALHSRTLGDSTAWRSLAMEIDYTAATQAFGFDMQGYQGYGLSGTVSVYDTNNVMLTASAVNGGFFGWENSAGIGRVVIAANSGDYIMIDDHGYGMTTAAIPEPSTYALMFGGMAIMGVVARRRRT